MIEGLLGHLPSWGQMSYWGITAMINTAAISPSWGIALSKLTWNNESVIINRPSIYHFLISIFIILLILIHILVPHNFSSSNPSINNNSSIISSYPFIFKDLYGSFITITIIISLLFILFIIYYACLYLLLSYFMHGWRNGS